MRKPHPTLTPQELAIMKVVWRLGATTVRDVRDALREQRPIAYTTVLTMMQILEAKGYVKKKKSDRAHVYRPAKSKHQVMGAMVREFVSRVFDGSAEPLLVHLARDVRLTEEERKELRRIIEESE